jgi:hypothetical protein
MLPKSFERSTLLLKFQENPRYPSLARHPTPIVGL